MSRTISSDQRSPKISSEMLTGQPERGLALDLRGTNRTVPSLALCKQARIATQNQDKIEQKREPFVTNSLGALC